MASRTGPVPLRRTAASLVNSTALNDRYWIPVLSGTDRSLMGSGLRAVLALAEPVYRLIVQTRNALYETGFLPTHRLPVPVISIGNLTTGGTGKTPVAAWLNQWCRSQGMNPGILSRGYRSLDGQENDEKRLLDQLCPGTPHIQHRNRVHAAQVMLQDFSADVLILDDGFQHRRLNRDLDLVLVDAMQPWGFGHLLPRGLLRESISGLSRAHAILVTRCDQVESGQLESLIAEIARWTGAPILRTVFAVTQLVSSAGQTCAIDALGGKRVGAICGIGNPGGFLRTLVGLGLVSTAADVYPFPDHHHYSPVDIVGIQQWAASRELDCLVTTRKDLVKLLMSELGTLPLWGVDIQLRFVDPGGEQPLEQLLKIALQRAANSPDNEK